MEEKVLKKARFVNDFVGPSLDDLQEQTDHLQLMCDWRYERGLNYHEMRRRRRYLLATKNFQILENDIRECELKHFTRKTRVEMLGYAADVEKQLDPATRADEYRAPAFAVSPQIDFSTTRTNNPTRTFTFQAEAPQSVLKKPPLQERQTTRDWGFTAQNKERVALAPAKRQPLRSLDVTPKVGFFPRP